MVYTQNLYEMNEENAVAKKDGFIIQCAAKNKMAVARNIDTDWTDNKSLPECMLYMLKNEIMCDVTFHVGVEKKLIRAHKYMLSSRSSVFHTMFEGSLPETGVISIPDIDKATFLTFLQYIYSDELRISNDNVKEMWYLSNKYMITRVMKECDKVLLKLASTSDAAISFLTAYEYKLDNLLNQSFSFIEKNTVQCLSSDYALDIPKECLELILKSEYLSCSETDLCTFLLKWTRNQCILTNIEASDENMRTMAGHLFCLVRFPLVDHEIFKQNISNIGFLTLNETSSFYQYSIGVTAENWLFSNKERKPVAKREVFTVSRFQKEAYGWPSNSIEAIRFKMDKVIWLKGVVIGNPKGNDLRNNIEFKVLSDDDIEVYSFIDRRSHYLNSSTTEVTFSDPVKILQSKKYTITMEGMLGSSYYSTNCLNPVTVSDVTFIFEKSPLCTSRTNENQGQFAGLLFSI